MPDFADLAAQLRELQHAFTAAAPPDDVIEQAIAHIAKATSLLQPWAVEESEQWAGRPYYFPVVARCSCRRTTSIRGARPR